MKRKIDDAAQEALERAKESRETKKGPHKAVEASSSHGSASDSSESSSSSSGSSDSEQDVAASGWAEFAHGSGKQDRIHFLSKGRLPPCANKVLVEEGGYGVGEADARTRNRRLCKSCCRKFGLKSNQWS